jgi:Cft2 family RNA processing exonuclease
VESGYLYVKGTKIKVKGNSQSGDGIWKFIPVTDSNGVVTGVFDVSMIEEIEPSICIGRVTQFSKHGTVLVKVSERCKVTLHSTRKLQTDMLYRFELEFRDGGLHIISEFSENREEKVPELLLLSQPITTKNLDQDWSKKLEPQIYQQYPGIKLKAPLFWKGIVEWEGTLDDRRIRIQGQSGSTALTFHEFTPRFNHAVNHPDILRVTPLGAARSIGASCLRVEIGNYEIVLDAGTRPKGSNPLPALEHLENPNLILITHAHQDHIGALPVLHSMFPTAPMVCTPGTREIARVMLSDCLKVQQKNEDFQPLFDETELQQTLLQLDTQPIGAEFEPLPGLKVRFINAGHIVGAACIHLQLGNKSLLYTGDYNLAKSRTTEGLKLSELPQADILITEATYGASVHSKRNEQESELVANITQVVQRGGNVLIPAFALGRAQEIILALKTSPIFPDNIPIYIDGLVRAVTDVFADNLQFLPKSVQNLANASRTEPFADNIKVIPISDPKERPLAIAKPSVIIASSGMLSGGPSVYYAQALLERENAAIFFSGYTDEESPGRLLQSMTQGEVVTIDQKYYTVRARIERFNLSAHTDRTGIGAVIAKVKPRHLVLIHGSTDALHDLARSDLQKHYIVHIPGVGQVIEYGVFPKFVSASTQVAVTHEKEIQLEIVSEDEGAWIRVPKDVVENDPRWQTLGQMSVVRAKWHNNGLMLMPVTAKTLALDKAKAGLTSCCAKCQFFRAGFCNQEDSPMYELLIDPNGVCLEFALNNVV